MDKETLQIDYALRPKTDVRRWVWRSIILTLVASAGFGIWKVGPRYWRLARLHYSGKACANYTAPPDEVAWEMRDIAPQRAAVQKSPVTKRPAAKCWQTFSSLGGFRDRPSYPMLFLHELRSPAGLVRLVVIFRYARPPDEEMMAMPFDKFTFRRGSWRTEPEATVFSLGGPRHAKTDRIYTYASSILFRAGQVDPADSSHFTIEYEAGTIDGWLRDDGRVEVDVRDGPGFRAYNSPSR